MKDKVRDFAISLGIDDIGFADVEDYHSPISTPIHDIFPNAQSIIVMAFRELDNCDSENEQIKIHGRMNLTAFSRSCNYRIARFLQKEFKAQVMSIQGSFPIRLDKKTGLVIADVSLRHAAAHTDNSAEN